MRVGVIVSIANVTLRSTFAKKQGSGVSDDPAVF